MGGYSALSEHIYAQKIHASEDIIEMITESGLERSRWSWFSHREKMGISTESSFGRWVKYIICNADEGDPGAYANRSLLEANPHSVLEGMIIGAYAVGANQGYIYVRAEYPLAMKYFDIAIRSAEALGLLGENILGTLDSHFM